MEGVQIGVVLRPSCGSAPLSPPVVLPPDVRARAASCAPVVDIASSRFAFERAYQRSLEDTALKATEAAAAGSAAGGGGGGGGGGDGGGSGGSGGDSGSAAVGSEDAGTCMRCTFQNAAGAAECGMCGYKAPN